MNWENVVVFVVVVAVCSAWFALLLLLSGVNLFA